MEDLNSCVANSISSVLRDRKLTNDNLSKLSSIHLADIEKITDSSNQEDLSLQTIATMAKALNISLDYIVGLSDEAHEEKELREKINAFINSKKTKNARPLSDKKIQKAIVLLRNQKVSWIEIKNFIKSEFTIDVSIEAIRKKYKTLTEG